jgi:hypothetical protein
MLGIAHRFIARRTRGAGALAGALAGAAYTVESAPHMVVASRYDTLITGILLSALGALVGCLVSAMIVLGPVDKRTSADSHEDGQAQESELQP